MAKIENNEVELEIIPKNHYYHWDGSDINEFYYVISFYVNGGLQAYPLGRNGELISEFDVETADEMISQACLESLYENKETWIDDIFNGGFEMFFTPVNNKWKIEIKLNPYYLEHKTGLEYRFELDKEVFFRFSTVLRLEEVKVIAK